MSKFLKTHIKHIDLSKNKNISDLINSLSSVSFQARNLSQCADVYRKMLEDKKAIIFLGLAGALVPGGMRKIIADLMRNHLVDVVVSTGANLYHDFFEAIGYHHYLGDAFARDEELHKAHVDRIYDTFASDVEFKRTEERIAKFASKLKKRIYSSREFIELLATEIDDNNSILYTAKREGVPIFCPALCDSAIGIALTYQYIQSIEGPKLVIDQIRDNFEVLQIKRQAETTGAFYLGGGVPKNYIQQLTPMLDAFGEEGKGHKYYIQLTTDDPKYGGSGGSTAREAESWGKVITHGLAATAYVDATIGLPLVAGVMLKDYKRGKRRKKRRFKWRGDILEGIKIG